MALRNPDWTRDELILALDLYFKLNPSHASAAHPDVIALSAVLNKLPIHPNRNDAESFRNPNGVYMKLCNFLRLDPSYSGVGLKAGAKLDEDVWNDFAGDRTRLKETAEAIQAGAELSINTEPELLSEDENEEAPEGKVLFRQHRIRERKTSLVRKKKALALSKYGVLACEVCDFIFSEYYGDIGADFIECHHTVPVSKLRPGQQTKLKDLALVCANCHRMLHRGGVVLTIESLKAIMSANRVSKQG